MSGSPRSPGDSQSLLLKTSLKGFSLALALSLILFTYERAVIPIYASVPTRLYLPHLTLLALTTPHLQPFRYLRSLLQWKWFVAGLALALAPNATYWVAIWTARWKDPYFGPAVLHAVVFVPLVSAIANCTVSHNDGPRFTTSVMDIAASFASYPIATYLASILANQSRLFEVSNSQILLYLSAFTTSYGIVFANFARSLAAGPPAKPIKGQKKRASSSASLSIPPIWKKLAALTCFNIFFCLSLYPILHSPVLPDPLKLPLVLPKPSADGVRIQILSSVQSTTGLIVVGEAMTPLKKDLEAYEKAGTIHSVRYLRAAHSLLGGVWFGPRAMALAEDDKPLRDSIGVVLGDSIYGTFVLQEAARLVNSTQKAPENALIIGLGTGIAATAFHRLNLNVSIVEIDPAVYNAARKFFGLPDLGHNNVFLEDARRWAARKHVESQKTGNETTLYDIVIHDCFSGGGVPQQLFSVEFLEDLKKVMHPEGIIVLNFAGYVISEPSRLILRTLERAFGGHCKAFFDSMTSLTEEQLRDDFMNIVFFCTLSPEPLTFRPAYVQDLLGSPLRRHMLGTLHSREINLTLLREGDEQDNVKGLPDVITDANNPLGKMQEQKAHHHWELMREVLPDVIWETY
ncbi:spermidine synthase [Lentinula aciculospora]|uniref:Spermidine synthase n=1 Tax=Lentinula aciculospora TaxID=153920 RepID=A0A9W9AC23_9AGAR|nr:spermidine synthase [Lentinula aciculospora]